MERIIKTYFVFVLFVIGIAVTGQVSELSHGPFMASVLNTFEIGPSEDGKEVAMSHLVKLEMELSKEGVDGYVKAGQEYAEVMKVKLRSYDDAVLLEDLRFKVEGVNPLAIKGMTIVKDNKVVERASRKNQYFSFDSLNYLLSPRSEEEISLRVDMNEEVRSGERFRLVIESEDDITVRAGAAPYTPSLQYPVKGPYVTVIKKKPIWRYIY